MKIKKVNEMDNFDDLVKPNLLRAASSNLLMTINEHVLKDLDKKTLIKKLTIVYEQLEEYIIKNNIKL